VTRRLRAAPAGGRLLAAGLACALALAGCADGSPRVSAQPAATAAAPTPAPSPSPSGPATQPAPSPTPGESGPPPTVACKGTDVTFPSAVLGPTFELLPLTPAGRALAAYLGTAAASELGLPGDGWRRASAAMTRTTFVAPAGGAWAFATMAEQADGSWEFDEGGTCELEATAPAGLGFASWRLDPSGPGADATRLSISAQEEACASGKAPGVRALAPIVDETDTTVTIALLVRRLESADCQGNPWYPVDVTLSRPLGGRTLLDGSSYPPSRRG
jgi:hypothetical protein